MAVPHILIVEDDLIIALDIECIVLEALDAKTTVVSSVETALPHLDEEIDFAFLDIDVRDGKTFGLAERLQDRGIPFTFVSGSNRARLPDMLQGSPFIAKPYVPNAIMQVLDEVVPPEKRASA
ncbi:response regulator [Microbaculum marinum]|uniref:Response regulator n=1 Tax=Microbaculum marinum TaxID=1764581 RepID=A0AAW9RLD2_9HYPH